MVHVYKNSSIQGKAYKETKHPCLTTLFFRDERAVLRIFLQEGLKDVEDPNMAFALSFAVKIGFAQFLYIFNLRC